MSGAEVLATYAHPHYSKWPAVTTTPHVDGRITYVGTIPDGVLARALFEFVRPAADQWGALPDSVTVRSAVDRGGRRVHFIHNWSWEPQEVTAPTHLHDVLTKTPINPATPVHLNPWDVRVLSE